MKSEAIELYVMKFSKNIQDKLFEIAHIVEDCYPDAQGRIAWRMPTYNINGIDVFHFSAQQKFISLYIGIEAMHFFEEATCKYARTMNVVHLGFDDEIPKQLILDSIEYNLTVYL